MLSQEKKRSVRKIEELKRRNEESAGNYTASMETFLSSIKSEEDTITSINIDLLENAPEEWNFYSELSEEKMVELIESIAANGLLHNLIVWNYKPDKYMILSGHNRVKALRTLFEMTKDEKYLYANALIKEQGSITEEIAQQIIVDTNWVQRSLNRHEILNSITSKYIYFEKQKQNIPRSEQAGRIRDMVAEYFEIGGRHVSNMLRLNNLIEPFMEMFKANKISLRNGLKLAKEDHETQQLFYNTYNHKINNAFLSRIDSIKQYKEEDSSKEKKVRKITLNIPAEREQEFWKFYREWVKKED